MFDTRKLAALAVAGAVAMTPAAAIGASHPTPHKHKSARATCLALRKKEGVKRFDARYGKGTKHTGALKRCIAKHTHHTKKKKA